MSKKRYIIIASGIMSILLGSLLVNNVILAQTGSSEYDPWADINDDGIIDMYDLAYLGKLYGTTGTPINKTALLLELQSRIDSLNASLIELQKHSFIKTDDYIIEKDGSTFKAFNGTTGELAYGSSGLVATIQWAHDQLTDGGSIGIKAGDYLGDWEKKLTITNMGINLHGASMRMTFLGAKFGLNDTMIEVKGINCNLHDFTLHGGGQTDGNGIYCDDSGGLCNLHLNDVYLLKIKKNGIYWAGADGCAYAVYSEYCGDNGWFILGALNCFVHCGGWGNKGYGWYITAYVENRYIGCIGASNEKSGFCLAKSKRQQIIAPEVKLNGGQGIWLYGAQRNSIIGGAIWDNSQTTSNLKDGIYLSTHPVGSVHSLLNVINGVQIWSSSDHRYGIYENDANQDQNTFTNCVVTDSVTANILLQGTNSHANLCWNGTDWLP